jgi:hypothetical protein
MVTLLLIRFASFSEAQWTVSGSELDSFDSLHFDPFCTGGVEIYGLYAYRNVVPKKRGVSALKLDE